MICELHYEGTKLNLNLTIGAINIFLPQNGTIINKITSHITLCLFLYFVSFDFAHVGT